MRFPRTYELIHTRTLNTPIRDPILSAPVSTGALQTRYFTDSQRWCDTVTWCKPPPKPVATCSIANYKKFHVWPQQRLRLERKEFAELPGIMSKVQDQGVNITNTLQQIFFIHIEQKLLAVAAKQHSTRMTTSLWCHVTWCSCKALPTL